MFQQKRRWIAAPVLSIRLLEACSEYLVADINTSSYTILSLNFFMRCELVTNLVDQVNNDQFVDKAIRSIMQGWVAALMTACLLFFKFIMLLLFGDDVLSILVNEFGIDEYDFLFESILFLAISIGVFKQSRIASLIGLLLTGLLILMSLIGVGFRNGMIYWFILLYFLFSSTFAIFRFQKFKKEQPEFKDKGYLQSLSNKEQKKWIYGGMSFAVVMYVGACLAVRLFAPLYAGFEELPPETTFILEKIYYFFTIPLLAIVGGGVALKYENKLGWITLMVSSVSIILLFEVMMWAFYAPIFAMAPK